MEDAVANVGPLVSVTRAEEMRREASIRQISVVLTALTAIATLSTIARIGWTAATWVMVLTTPVFFTAAILARSRLHRWAAPLTIVAMLLQHTASQWVTPPHVNAPTPYFTSMAIFIAAMTLGPRGVIATTVATFTALGAMAAMRWSQLSSPNENLDDAIPFFLALLMAMIAIVQSLGAHRSLLSQVAREKEGERLRAIAQENEKKYSLIANNTDDLVLLIDENFEIVFASPSHERVLDLSPRALKGLVPSTFLHPDDLDNVTKTVRLAKTRGSARTEARIETAKGNYRWFDISLSAVSLDGKPHTVVGCRDIHEKKDIALALEESQRLEALGRLSSAVAHDFNNLLTIVGGEADLALGEMTAGAPGTSELTHILSTVEKARGLTKQLLVFGKEEAQSARQSDITSVMKSLSPLCETLVGSGIDLSFTLPDEPVYVPADPTQLEQVVMNLVVNARDAMTSGGRLSVMVERHPDGAASSGRVSHFQVNEVVVTVSDTGTGIPPEVRSRIFEPYFTTKDGSKGTGLGLSTVYGIVSRLGGVIDVDSGVGSGTTFRVHLPTSQRPPQAA